MTSSVVYEKFVQEIYQALLDQDTTINNITVQHNVKVLGKSGAEHQIDVYWEFEIAGIVYKTCIECRKYKSSIKKSQVAAFAKTVEDIGNANGIMVTTAGYQSGAKILAQHERIRLLLVKPVLNTINIKLRATQSELKDFNIELDKAFTEKVKSETGHDILIVQVQGSPDDIFLLDSNGNQTQTIADIIAPYTENEGDCLVELEDKYLRTEQGPLVKVSSFGFSVVIHKFSQEVIIGGEYVARALVEDVLANTSEYIFGDGTKSDKPKKEE